MKLILLLWTKQSNMASSISRNKILLAIWWSKKSNGILNPPPTSATFRRNLGKACKIGKGVSGNHRTHVYWRIIACFFIQAKSLLNGRPLTYVSVDHRDPEPLTHNHFLLAHNLPNTEKDIIEDENLYSVKHWEAMQVMTTYFWRRWLQESYIFVVVCLCMCACAVCM